MTLKWENYAVLRGSKILDNAELLKILLIMKTSKQVHVYSDMPIQVSWKWSLELVKKIMVWRKSKISLAWTLKLLGKQFMACLGEKDFLGLDIETACLMTV